MSFTEISRRYASALYELAEQHNRVDAIRAELNTLKQLISQSTSLQRLMRSPIVSLAVQAKALQTILEQMQVTALTKNFVGLVVRNHRVSFLERFIDSFEATIKTRRGQVHVEVSVARQLTETQHTKLLNTLTSSLHPKTIDVHISVDPSCLGGMSVRIGSRMIDNTLKAKLHTLQRTLKEVERLT